MTGLSFWAALWLYLQFVDTLAPDFPPISTGLKMVAAAFIFWSVPKIFGWGDYGGAQVNSFQKFCLSAGAIIICQAAMLNANRVHALPLPVLAPGAVFASLLTALSGAWLYPRYARFRPGAVIVGADSVVRGWIDSFRQPIFGFVESDASRVPQGYSYLGSMSDLGSVAVSLRPSQIVVGSSELAVADSARPVAGTCAWPGIAVKEAGAVYEQVFERVCTERLEARELLFSQSMGTRRGTLAFQSIYNNLAGLLLLLCALPVLAVAALFLRLSAGSGPILEKIDCQGFQGIPFQLLRFRTRGRDGTGDTIAGRVISRLGLTALPQLFNVMRGEMGLIGPAPVRIQQFRPLVQRAACRSYSSSVFGENRAWPDGPRSCDLRRTRCRGAAGT